jgi:NAD(P)H-flavin reductase/hemoglobin-like flavoprotein
MVTGLRGSREGSPGQDTGQDGRGAGRHLRTVHDAAGPGGMPDQASQEPAGTGPEEPGVPTGDPARPDSPDPRILRKSLAQIEGQSGKVMEYFFARLFARHPPLRPLFPLALDGHYPRIFSLLAQYAWTADRPGALTEWLAELARDLRKFGVREAHYRLVCETLFEALRAFAPGWGSEPLAAWRAALEHIAAVMTDAGRDDQEQPPWWLAEVVEHEQRRPGLAVLTLRPDQPLPYRAGQHVSVQVPQQPRVWREYSVANAPAPDGLLRLHVRAIPGGAVSPVLVHRTAPGDTLVIGRARGTMTADAVSAADLVCLAGGTGLAPVKAIVEELAGQPPPRPDITVFFGARSEAGLYDLPDLRRLARCCPSLTVIPVVCGEPGYLGAQGTLAEVAAGRLPPGTRDVVISGPPAMVTACAAALAPRAPAVRIHHDPLPDWACR